MTTRIESMQDSESNIIIRAIIVKALLVVLAVATVFPFVWMIFASMRSNGDILAKPAQLIPSEFFFNTYIDIWSAVPFARYFMNSFIFACAVLILALTFDSMAGYAFARLQFKGKNTIFTLILCTMMIPFQCVMIPLFLLENSLGMIDTYAGLIIPRAADVFGIFMMRQFFLTLPKDLEEAGRIDGSNEFGIFFRIMLPQCKPAFVTLGVFNFMGNWNDLLYPMLLTNSEQFRPIQAAIALFSGKYGTDYSFTMTGLILTVIPTITAYIFAQRYFIEGISMTGLK